MNKGVILLVNADSKEEAIEKTSDFLEIYGDGDVWDWYTIGGRWSGTLNSKKNEFYKKVEELNIPITYYSEIEEKENQIKLQKVWKELGETSLNPILRDSFKHSQFSNNKFHLKEGIDYIKELEKEEYSDDILPLKDCINIVKDWKQDGIESGKKEEERAKEWITGENIDNPNYHMYGYCLKKAGELYAEDFCFDCNVFNIDSDNYSIPENIDGYYAVMIDMHN